MSELWEEMGGGEMKKKRLQYWGKSEPICPYCDCKHPDWWEVIENPLSDELVEMDCNSCGKTFSVQPATSITFSTNGDCEVHELACDHITPSAKHYVCQVCATEFYDWYLEGGEYEKLKKHQYVILQEEPTGEI